MVEYFNKLSYRSAETQNPASEQERRYKMEDVKDLIREASRLAQFHFSYEELIWLADKTCRLTILKELQAGIPGRFFKRRLFSIRSPNNYPSEYWELCIRLC